MPVQIFDVLEPLVVLGCVQDRILQRLVEQTPMNDTEQVIEVPLPRPTSSRCSSCAAGARTVGGSAGCVRVVLRPQCSCAADGGISWWKCRLSRLRQSSSTLSSRPLTFHFLVVEHFFVKFFMVSSQVKQIIKTSEVFSTELYCVWLSRSSCPAKFSRTTGYRSVSWCRTF